MNKDLNKNITSVSYNLLNLPAQVTFVSQPQSLVTTIGGVQFELSSGGKTLTSGGSTHTHTYTYAADGRKLKVVQDDMVRDYVGGIIYENGSLKRVLIDGGYVESGTYYYYLNDHLGNTRVVASGTGTVLQKNEYYPFGMPMAETANADQDKQPYKYNGKEFERKDGLNWMDYGARHYDAALGRFMTVDLLAEKKPWLTPYHYCSNNPINRIDPTGMADTDYEIDEKGVIKRIGEIDDKPDKLHGTNQATKEKEVLTVKDKSILPALSGESNITNNRKPEVGKIITKISGGKVTREKKLETTDGHAAITNSQSEAKTVFEFAAKTSTVEWSVSLYKNGKGVSRYSS